MIGVENQSKSLQDAVFKFFELHGDEAEIEKNEHHGVATIRLKGSLAELFRRETSPDPHDSEVRLLKLLLDARRATLMKGHQTIAPRSRLVEIIENHLQREPVRFSRSVAGINASKTYNDLVSLGVTVGHCKPVVDCSSKMRRFFIATWLFRQTAYEVQEDYIPIVIDMETGGVIDPRLAGHFASLKCVDCNHSTDLSEGDALLAPVDENRLTELLAATEIEAQQRAQVVAVRTHKEKNEEYQNELERLKLVLEAERAGANTAKQKREVQEKYDQEIEKLEQSHRVQSQLTLVSLQEVQVPQVTYEMSALVDDHKVPLGKPFFYDPLGDAVSTEFCDNCGRSQEHKEWNFCYRGLHLECGSCDTVTRCSESDCRRTSCEVHRVGCLVCNREICEDHKRNCSYCQSHEPHCGDCIQPSFEHRDICGKCREQCFACEKFFPFSGGHLGLCGVCGNTFCGDDYAICSNCDLPSCSNDRHAVVGREEEFCTNCCDGCIDCDSTRNYMVADLATCKIGAEPVCDTHVSECSNCRGALCVEHSLDTVAGPGCDDCYHSCATCRDKPILRGELAQCPHCPPNTSWHCTNQGHATLCTICNRHVCGQHRVTLANSHFACASCAKACSECNDLFDPATMARCNQCGNAVCAAHTVASEFDQAPFCTTHANEFVHCNGCDQRGPIHQLGACSNCRIEYGPNCVASSGDCKYCGELKPIQFDQVQSIVPAEISHACIAAPHSYLWEFAETHSHKIIQAKWHGGWLGFILWWFATIESYVVVCSKSTGDCRIHENRFGNENG